MKRFAPYFRQSSWYKSKPVSNHKQIQWKLANRDGVSPSLFAMYANGDTVSYTYGLFDRTTAETYNDGTTYHYVYDAEGDLARQNPPDAQLQASLLQT